MADGTIYGGQLAVSVNGGGTCNTEFECLTGESMLYAGVGKYPYNMYNFAGVANVARQLGELGYKTTAMHPNVGTNWHRNTVYRQFGFDEFLTIEDFPDDAPRFHSGLTDKVTYDKVLEVLRSGDEPQFVKDYFDYYKTRRGFHPRSINSNGAWNATSALSFLNMPLLAYAGEIRSAVLLVHGEKAHSRYFSEDAFKKLSGNNKELMIVPRASHTDLYDRVDIIPFDRIEAFFKANL